MTNSNANPSNNEIDDVLEIVGEIATAKRPSERLNRYEKLLSTWCESLFSHQNIGVALSLLLATVSAIFHSPALANTSFATLMLSQTLSLILMVLIILYSIPFLYNFLKSPQNHFLKLVKLSCKFNLHYVEKLSHCNVLAIRYVLSHYEGERLAFEKRCSVLVGSIEKIGILPALAGLAVLSINLSKPHILQSWTNSLLALILAFYIMSMGAFTLMQRQDRVISILLYFLKATD